MEKLIYNKLERKFVMILVFLILILLIILIILIFSSIELDIKKLYLSNNNNELKLKNDVLLYIKIKLFSKIKILKIKIDKDKINKIKEKIGEIDFKKIRKKGKFNKENLKILDNVSLKIKKFNLNINIGLESVLALSFVIPFFSTIISIFLANNIKDIKRQECSYCIKPIYKGKNIIDLEFTSIFSIKIVHIIYIIFIYLKKKGEMNKDERTSNRRSYAYRYE